MKNFIYVQIIAVGLLFVGCSAESVDNKADNGVPVTNAVSENVLFTGETNYSKILQTDAPVVGYSTMKQNSLAEEQFVTVDNSTPNTILSKSMDGSTLQTTTNVSLAVNGLKLSKLQSYVSSKSSQSSAQSRVAAATSSFLYGANVNFTVSRNTVKNSVVGLQKVSSASTSDTTITMYVPNLVAITSPAIQNSAELFPYCYYKGFVLGWNADSQNSNGLVVMVEWYGTSIKSEKLNKYVRNIDIITQDNGRTVINEKLFDNIPEYAVAYITLLRGNISIVDNLSADPYRLVAESHAILPIVVVKHI